MDVPGFRDPFWRGLQVAAVLGWIGITVAVGAFAGPGPAILTAIGLAGLLWLVSRAL
jgi:hypothetical protein